MYAAVISILEQKYRAPAVARVADALRRLRAGETVDADVVDAATGRNWGRQFSPFYVRGLAARGPEPRRRQIPRTCEGGNVGIPQETGRGDAAATTWTFSGGGNGRSRISQEKKISSRPSVQGRQPAKTSAQSLRGASQASGAARAGAEGSSVAEGRGAPFCATYLREVRDH